MNTISLFKMLEPVIEEFKDPLLEPIIQESKKLDVITNYKESLVEKTVKKGTETFLTAITDWIKKGIITILDYAGGLCFIIGSVAIIGMMVDSDNDLGCKKYVIGSLLVYIGIKCIKIILV